MNATPLRVADVFVPGRFPRYTYNPRSNRDLEGLLERSIESGGSILTVAGLTKMGKTVLIDKVLGSTDPVRLDGSAVDSLEAFWARVADRLGVMNDLSVSSSASEAVTAGGGVAGGVPALFTANAQTEGTSATSSQLTSSVQRPIVESASQALWQSGRTLIVDDFHFIPRLVQRDVVRSLKGLVYQGLTVIFIATTHRALDAALAEQNMGGRTEIIDIDLWQEEELKEIARLGFMRLNLLDPGDAICSRLSREALGSPHLMQKFCASICLLNGLREATADAFQLLPPADWDDFFRSQIDRLARQWFTRLMRGPQERRSRNTWARERGGRADTYALVMEALAVEKPSTSITADRVKVVVNSLLVPEQGVTPPAAHQITRSLRNIGIIAKRPLDEQLPFEDDEMELEGGLVAEPDIQSVVDFTDAGPISQLTITDPFFAFYVRWGADENFGGSPDGDASY